MTLHYVHLCDRQREQAAERARQSITVLMGLWNGQAMSGDAPVVQHIDEGSHVIDLVGAAREGVAADGGSPTRENGTVILGLPTLQHGQELRDHKR